MLPGNERPPAEWPDTGTTPDLLAIICEIRKEHAAAWRETLSAFEHTRQCGRWLTLASAAVAPGEWPSWLAGHVPDLSLDTAQGYMRLAASLPDPQAAPTGRRASSWSLRESFYRRCGLVLAWVIERVPPEIRAHQCTRLAESIKGQGNAR
jgi:hypothetical protein